MRNSTANKLIGILLMGGLATAGLAESTYTLSAENMFVPEGFDDNDGVQIVLDGWINSSCDTVLKPKIHVNLGNNTIHLEAQAKTGNYECLPVRTRYTKVAHVGVLPYGDFEVITNNGWLVRNLTVGEATNSGPDEFQYADVKEAFIDYAPDDKNDSKWSVVMKGQFKNSCQKWDKIEAKLDNNTYVILAKIKTEGEICLPIVEDFVARVFIEEPMTESRYLAHVRAANGKALNVVFTGH
jgi:hypothetical protein